MSSWLFLARSGEVVIFTGGFGVGWVNLTAIMIC